MIPVVLEWRSTVGIATVGRPKKTSRRPDAPSPKTIGYRVSGEYGQWLEALADHYRTTCAGIIDRALAEWAEAQGYPETPPKRMP
jgi:hypothetical protein